MFCDTYQEEFPGVVEKRGFVIKDTLMKGLPHDGLPCHINQDNEELGYDGGIGECIDSMFNEMTCLTM